MAGAYDVRDDEVGSALRLVVDAAQVLADQAEEEQLDAGEERDRDDQRREALRRVPRNRRWKIAHSA